MEVVISPFEECNFTYIIDKLKRHIKNHEQAWVIVPEQYTLSTDLRLIKDLQAESLMDIQIKSFSSLSRQYLKDLPMSNQLVLDELGRRFVINKIIGDLDEKLTIYKKESQTKQVKGIDSILKTITDLRQANIQGAYLKQVAEKVNDQHLKMKLLDISQILSQYEQLTENYFFDSEKRLGLLKKTLLETEVTPKPALYFCYFQGMNKLELEVLEAMAQTGFDITVSLVASKSVMNSGTKFEQSIFQASKDFYKQLKNLNIVNPLTPIYLEPTISPQLERRAKLVASVFDHHTHHEEMFTEQIKVMEATNINEECTAIAAWINKKVQVDGARYRDFTIAVSNTGEYFPAFKTIFTNHNIPVFIDDRTPLVEQVYIGYLINLLSMISTNFSRTSVVFFLKNIFSGCSCEEVNDFENWIRRQNLNGISILSEAYYEVEILPSQKTEEIERLQKECDVAKQVRSRLENHVRPFLENNSAPMTVDDFIQIILSLFDDSAFKSLRKQYIEDMQAEKNEMALRLSEQALKILSNYLNEFYETLKGDEASLDYWIYLFIDGLEALTIGIIPPSQDEVSVGSITRMRAEPSKFLIVCGLSDKFFLNSSDQGEIFLDAEKDLLATWQITLPQIAGVHLADDKLAFYQLLLKADEEVLLSYPLLTSQSEVMQSSYALKKIRRFSPEIGVLNAQQLINRHILFSFDTFMKKSMRILKEPEQYTDEDVSYAYAWYLLVKDLDPLKTKFVDLALQYPGERAILSTEISKELYKKKNKKASVSVSQLETMAACPYKHFIRYGIKPEEQIDFSLERHEIGTLLHASMDKLGELINRQRNQLDNIAHEDIQGMIDETIDTVAEKNYYTRKKDDFRNQYLLRETKEEAFNAGLHIIRQTIHSDFQILGEEVSFGSEDHHHFPAIPLQVADETYYLEGRIDRVDFYDSVEEKWLRVIDYKTGGKTLEISRMWAGIDIQLLIYLEAATIGGQYHPAGSFYLSLKEPIIKAPKTDMEKVKQEHKKAFLMDGLMVNVEDVLHAMDHAFENNPESLYLKGRSKELEKKENLMSEEALNKLLKRTVTLAAEYLDAAVHGEITVQPFKYKDQTACDYCEYANLCRFNLEYDEYRFIESKKWQTIIEQLKEEV